MLYIVGTPIGNLEDITIRAKQVLEEVDIVLAEDTRMARKLLGRLDISKKIIRFDENAREEKFILISKLLKENKMAFVSDAGTSTQSVFLANGWSTGNYFQANFSIFQDNRLDINLPFSSPQFYIYDIRTAT